MQQTYARQKLMVGGWKRGISCCVLAAGVAGSPGHVVAATTEPERVSEHALWVAAAGSRLRLGYRAEVPLALGPELGAYPFRYLRLAGRLLVAPRPASDGCYPDIFFGGGRTAELGYWFCEPSRSARFAFTLSAGAVVIDTPHWSIAPGAIVMRSDVADYGTALGFSLPVTWRAPAGLTLGLELALGDTFGQHLVLNCSPVWMNPCASGSTATGPNLFTWSALAALSVGWSFDLRPDAK